MGIPRPPAPVVLLVGLLSGDPDLLRRARQLLSRRFGPIQHESPLWPFEATDYYAAEMGTGLQRGFASFAQLIAPDHLVEVKHETNALEAQIAEQCLQPDLARPVNIDPGYIDLSKLVLASTKDSGHRVCIGRNLYAEVTLRYQHGAWHTLPWTYPDYARPEYHAFFTRVRAGLRQQRVAQTDPEPPCGAAP